MRAPLPNTPDHCHVIPTSGQCEVTCVIRPRFPIGFEIQFKNARDIEATRTFKMALKIRVQLRL